MSPVVVNREQFERLQKWKDKDKNVNYNHNPPRRKEFESRYLFLRYKKGGGHRVKRLEVRNKILGAGVQSKVIVKFKMSSPEKDDKNGINQTLALELGPDHLEPLLEQTLQRLRANPGELDYYWECE